MNEILKFLNSHASIRQFKNQGISAEKEKTILTTAQRSPTSSNVQAYSIISTRDKTKKQKFARLAGGQQHVEDCPLFLVFCADLYRLKCLNERRGYVFHGDYTEAFIIATIDAALVAARALMAAQALGIGGVMVGGIRNQPEEVSMLLKLPELVYPVMGMSLGYPMSEPEIKPRLPQEGVCFDEQYDFNRFDRAIRAYDKTMNRLGCLKGREVEPEKYSAFNGQYTWSEHTARRMASDDPNVLRPHMLEYLQSRGFLKN